MDKKDAENMKGGTSSDARNIDTLRSENEHSLDGSGAPR